MCVCFYFKKYIYRKIYLRKSRRYSCEIIWHNYLPLCFLFFNIKLTSFFVYLYFNRCFLPSNLFLNFNYNLNNNFFINAERSNHNLLISRLKKIDDNWTSNFQERYIWILRKPLKKSVSKILKTFLHVQHFVEILKHIQKLFYIA